MIPKLMTTKDVAAATLRGVNRVKNASNSGALKSLPRVDGAPHRFTEDQVADWIQRGCPEMPALVSVPQRRRSAGGVQ